MRILSYKEFRGAPAGVLFRAQLGGPDCLDFGPLCVKGQTLDAPRTFEWLELGQHPADESGLLLSGQPQKMSEDLCSGRDFCLPVGAGFLVYNTGELESIRRVLDGALAAVL